MEVLKETENFEWEEIDIVNDVNQKAFVDKIVQKTQLKNMDLELPKPYTISREEESKKKMMAIKIQGLVQNVFKSNFNRKYKQSVHNLDR